MASPNQLEVSPPPRAMLFVTGMQRSGTTLVDKLLSAHPLVGVLSQPLPLLYVHLKRAFLVEVTGEPDPYPLGPLFRDLRYRPEDFTRWLSERGLDTETLVSVLDTMAGYSGQYTPLSASQRARLCALAPRASFADSLAHILEQIQSKPKARVFGVKETTCEEFVPHLLAHDWRCLLVLRDPRDVVASLNHGRGESHAGAPKPLLFNLRQWRKSVAFALHCAQAPAFHAVRYEDLVRCPRDVLQDIGTRIGVSGWSAGIDSGEVRDQSGETWAGNSSHGDRRGVTRDSIGIYRRFLSDGEIRFIEAACGPEMRHLGYLDSPVDDPPAVLRSFVDPHAHTRPELRWYGDVAARADEEIRRLELLRRAPGQPEIDSYFLFADAYDALAESASR